MDIARSEIENAPPGVRTPRHSDLVIDPILVDWAPPETINAEAVAFRAELGLPTDRPIVMTGHQPMFWHAGILTKYLVADAIAKRSSIAGREIKVAWCVPDHVTSEPGVAAFPERAGAGSSGEWARKQVDLFEGPGGLPGPLEDALARLLDSDGSRAERQIRAHAGVLDDRLGLRTSSPVILATAIGRTRRFADALAEMAADPARCAGIYNAAAAAHPDAGVRALTLGSDESEIELPIWRLTGSGAPESIHAGEVADAEPGSLVPRALLFTGLLRGLGCDLFIHGTGGGIYDRVTEGWLAEWLGWTLAPTGVATATLTLDLGIPDVDSADLKRAKWRAHNAAHNPAAIGRSKELIAADEQKRALLARIGLAERGTRAPFYFEMHRLLTDVRRAHAEELELIKAEVSRVEAGLADRAISADRTWPWILHSDSDLRALREAVDRAIGSTK